MKRKFSRVLGIGLSLILLASLMVMAIPASAGTLSWGSEKDPEALVENTLLAGSDIVALAANGDTVFAATGTGIGSLATYSDGEASWSTDYANTGSYSVELYTGDVHGESAGRVYVPIAPIDFQALVSDPSYMLYETDVTLDTTYGGACDVSAGPAQVEVPWGHPYVNIVLDLDGDLSTTDDIDKLEGVGSSAGGAMTGSEEPLAGEPPTEDTWTSMQEAWGYYDGGDSIEGLTGGYSGFFKIHTLADWKNELASAHSNAKVIGIEITFGFWKAEKMPQGPVYVDDITINDVTYTLEDSILYKSTDAGATWTSLASTTSFPSGVSVKAIAIAPDNADVVAIITSANEVEYSTTGGSSWTDLNAPADGATAQSIDVSSGTTKYVAVGGRTSGGDVEMWTIKLTMAESWTARMHPTTYTTSGIAEGQTDIKAVRFSPNFTIDKAIAVVSGDGTSATFQLFRYESGDYDWNGAIDYLPSSGDADWGTGIVLDTKVVIAGGLGAADIALPSDYLANDEGYRTAFVAVAGADSGGGVNRLTDTVTADFDLWNDGPPGGVGSIAYHEAGKLVGGDYDTNRVFSWSTPFSGSSPNAGRVNSLKQPGGVDKTVVALSGDTVVAGTQGDESAIAISTDDGYSFNDVGLIDTTLSVFDDFAVNADGSKVYLTTHDTSEAGNFDASVWLKESSSWTRIFSLRGIADAANAPFLVRIAPDDDTAVYVSSKNSQDIWVSKNSGKESWKSVPCYKVTAIQDFVVENADVVYALDTATGQGVSKTLNAGASWASTKEPTKTFTGHMITLAPNGDILVGGSNGYVAYSKDGGATFERTKVVSAGADIQVVADDDYADNNIIYACAGTSVKRGKASTTASWDTRGTTTLPIVGIAQVEDVTYVLAAESGENSLLYMSLKLETAGSEDLAEWSYVNAGTKAETYLNTPQALKLSISDSKPKLWAIDTTSPDLESYTDAIALAGPTLASPADAVSVDVNPGTGRSYDITFIWERYSDSDIDEMELQIATDSAFDAVIYGETFKEITTDTIAKVIGPTGQQYRECEFMPGATYYWRVRCGKEGPMYSPWSEVRSFTIKSTVEFELVSPALGALDVPIDPTFLWDEFKGAISYEIMVAEDPTFAIWDWVHTSDATYYKPAETLAYSTTYYWRVRGITGPVPAKGAAPGGPWVSGVFTTIAKPVEVAPPIVVEPTPPAEVTVIEIPVAGPAQAIPGYLLVTIIAIGAVLIIALIVLIVRTRRVA